MTASSSPLAVTLPLAISLCLVACAGVVDVDDRAIDGADAPSAEPTPSTPEPPSVAPEPADDDSIPPLSGPPPSDDDDDDDDDDEEPACSAGTTFDGVGCGQWSPVASSCVAFDEVMPGGRVYGSRCQVAPEDATVLTTAWVEPGGAMVDLADGSGLVIREAPSATLDSTEKAETWVRAAGASGSTEWSRVGDATSIERPSEAVLLPDGRVLAVGCVVRNRCSHVAAEVFDPAVGAWVDSFLSPEMWPGNDSLFALPDGDVLFIDSSRAARIRVAERVWQVGPSPETAMDCPAVELIADGRALVVGGSLYGWERTAHLLDVETLAWHRAADPGLYTFMSRATRAAGGVVVFGSGSEEGAQAKVYTSTAP